jgi:hypothetical protein
LAAGLPVEMVRALRALAVQDALSVRGAAPVVLDAVVAQSQTSAASELYLVAERPALIRCSLVEQALVPLPVRGYSNALSV